MRTLRRRLLSLAAGALVVACAGPRALVEEDGLGVRVINNLIPSATVTVTLVPDAGGSFRLGDVSPTETEVLRLGMDAPSPPYRLVATTPAGARLTSVPILASDAGLLEWDLSRNTVRVVEERAP